MPFLKKSVYKLVLHVNYFMKIRSGFVSNSSSSSFIVMGTATKEDIFELRKKWGNRDNLLISPDLGVHQFGWDEIQYRNFWDRVFFAWIQAKIMQKERNKGGRPNWMKMLNKVLKANLKVKNIYWNVSFEYPEAGKWDDWCYIDHQSSAEDDKNIEMFRSEQKLVDFLFSPKSYIQGGNDNG